MRVHCDEGIANHIGPEPCDGTREGIGEASAGERAAELGTGFQQAEDAQATYPAANLTMLSKEVEQLLIIDVEYVRVDLDDIPVRVHQINLGETRGCFGSNGHASEFVNAWRAGLLVAAPDQVSQSIPVAADPDSKVDVTAVEALAVPEGRTLIHDQMKLLFRTEREPGTLEVEIGAVDLR